MCNHKLSHRNKAVELAMISAAAVFEKNGGQLEGHRSIKGFAEEIEELFGDGVEAISVTHKTRIGRLITAIEVLIDRRLIYFNDRSRRLIVTRNGRRAFAQIPIATT
jgi:hypothetical protein